MWKVSDNQITDSYFDEEALIDLVSETDKLKLNNLIVNPIVVAR
jgi:hypothetical protein